VIPTKTPLDAADDSTFGGAEIAENTLLIKQKDAPEYCFSIAPDPAA
jgi:hypothetical protein